MECWISGVPLRADAGAAYAMTAGLAAAITRVILSLKMGPSGARAGVLVVLAGFASLHLLYYVNVRLLPGEPYFSPKSLGADALLGAGVLLVVFAVTRSVHFQEVRGRFSATWVGVGPLLFVIATTVLVYTRPTGPSPILERAGTGPNIVLVVMDSSRRDHLSVYGYQRPTSPLMEAFGGHARVYERAYAASSWTVPSVTELLWSRLEGEGSAGDGLAARLVSRGYVTACFSDNPHLNPDSPLLKGFDVVEGSVGTWRHAFHGTVIGAVIERFLPGADRDLVDRALAWASSRSGPFFLYVHLMDSHAPYRQRPIDGKYRPGRRIQFPFSGLNIRPDEAEDLVARYDAGVRSADASAGRLLEAAPGWQRPFVAIVTADHGESLGEGGRWFHGGSLAPELLEVPLIVFGQGLEPGRFHVAVGHDSITKTILLTGGVSCPDCSGVDLRSEGGNNTAEGGLPPDLVYRIADGHKLVLNRKTNRASLFDLRRDPLEILDTAADLPDLVKSLTAGLGADASLPRGSSEARDRVKALGYVN
jgi:arylsulfatase A-like enzyme